MKKICFRLTLSICINHEYTGCLIVSLYVGDEVDVIGQLVETVIDVVVRSKISRRCSDK